MPIESFINSEQETLRGWRYLWAKTVTAFDPAVHCARCLIGDYEKTFSIRTPVNTVLELRRHATGTVIYFCGVSAPYRWGNNMHLAVRSTGDLVDTAQTEFYNGDRLIVRGARQLSFDDQVARLRYPTLGAEYLTCRNFQFGAAFLSDS
jgi:hypothetical protein